ncbi:MAG: 50S ribosomal protein L17 [Candidatus Saganbacteria bacterium]|nr:50S ribosomal protein L17 [Candidatus Saganbacteria bacterium]
MRHGLRYKKLGKKSTARMSMLIAQVEALIERGKIKIPLVRAKQVRRIAEKLITKSKKDTVASRRNIGSKLINRNKIKLVMEAGKRYADRPGGFTRIIKLGLRKGDAAKMAMLELV